MALKFKTSIIVEQAQLPEQLSRPKDTEWTEVSKLIGKVEFMIYNRFAQDYISHFRKFLPFTLSIFRFKCFEPTKVLPN